MTKFELLLCTRCLRLNFNRLRYTTAGVDRLHIEVRDGKYVDFAMPRDGFDIIEATCCSTPLEVEAQLQMARPNFSVFDQLADLGVSLISLPLETTNEMIFQNIIYIKEKLGLKVGVWVWQGVPAYAFEQFLHPLVNIIEVGMTVGEFSSLLLKGPDGKLQPGAGQIKAAVENLRAIMREASDDFRDQRGLKV